MLMLKELFLPKARGVWREGQRDLSPRGKLLHVFILPEAKGL